MKKLSPIAIGLCFGVTNCIAAPQPPAPKVLLAQMQSIQPDKIAQVKAGTLKEAQASWWGFDKDDATECLQNAINSGVPKLVVDNVGSEWIIGNPIHLISHQQIIFADGVVIQAKRDAFHGSNDSLFMGDNLTDLTLQGEGSAVLRMRKTDYQNPNEYSKAEWRMGIRLMDCKDVVIRNLTVAETGGDGLYLGAGETGYNKNILVENCIFDANHRLGMAIISAEDVTIRDCKFINTDGTAPNGGLDFEPNFAGQRLVNIKVRNCEFYGNTKGSGIEIYAIKLNDQSLPLSIYFNNCRIKGNSSGMLSTIWAKDAAHSVKGEIILDDCHFDNNRVTLRNQSLNSATYLFKNCTFDYVGTKGWDNTPFNFINDSSVKNVTFGGVTFDHSMATIDTGNKFISGPQQGVSQFSDKIGGVLSIRQNGITMSFNWAKYIKEQQDYWKKINALKTATIDLKTLRPPKENRARTGNNQFYLQSKFTFLQYANKGEIITINVLARKVYDMATELELQDPGGKTLQTVRLPLNGRIVPITFTAQETGLYRVVRKSTFSQYIDVTSGQRGNGLLVEGGLLFVKPQGRLYFQVPAGVRTFMIGISTDSSADVALLNQFGNEVERHNGIKNLTLFTGSRADVSKSETWSIEVSNAVWQVSVNMYEPLVPIVSTNPETLLLIQ